MYTVAIRLGIIQYSNLSMLDKSTIIFANTSHRNLVVLVITPPSILKQAFRTNFDEVFTTVACSQIEVGQMPAYACTLSIHPLLYQNIEAAVLLIFVLGLVPREVSVLDSLNAWFRVLEKYQSQEFSLFLLMYFQRSRSRYDRQLWVKRTRNRPEIRLLVEERDIIIKDFALRIHNRTGGSFDGRPKNTRILAAKTSSVGFTYLPPFSNSSGVDNLGTERSMKQPVSLGPAKRRITFNSASIRLHSDAVGQGAVIGCVITMITFMSCLCHIDSDLSGRQRHLAVEVSTSTSTPYYLAL